jgi:uncharacterized protein
VSERAAILESLDGEYTEAYRDPLWKHVYLSPCLLGVTRAEPFLKLTRIKQLGPTYLVYPGATHTRASHSIGVFHIAKRILRAVLSKEGADFLSLGGCRAFLAAALLHDLGHYPYAHSLKELPLREHETLTADLIQSSPLRESLSSGGIDPYMAAAIVDGALPSQGNREVAFFRSLLSGVLDPDKLDYLNRDAYFCGVPYGTQDIDYVISRLSLGPDDRLAVDERGIPSIESLLFAKYLMYRTVYWHPAVRSATCMAKEAILEPLETGALDPDSLYNLDDSGFFERCARLGGKTASLAAMVASRSFYEACIDIPFDPSQRSGLASLEGRAQASRRLAAELGLEPSRCLIDVPEPISFESDMPVLMEGGGNTWRGFPESGTVFTPGLVSSLTASLRRLRVFVPRELKDELGPRALAALRSIA